MTRPLEDRTAVIYGAGGAIGGAVGQAFAREGAQVFLTGRRLAPLERVATEIKRAGGAARVAQVDALDEAAIERHLDQVVRKSAASISLSMRWASMRSKACRS
jgi:NADP-dependent 3-hydroxy acid dehydrogenase YdfG